MLLHIWLEYKCLPLRFYHLLSDSSCSSMAWTLSLEIKRKYLDCILGKDIPSKLAFLSNIDSQGLKPCSKLIIIGQPWPEPQLGINTCFIKY